MRPQVQLSCHPQEISADLEMSNSFIFYNRWLLLGRLRVVKLIVSSRTKNAGHQDSGKTFILKKLGRRQVKNYRAASFPGNIFITPGGEIRQRRVPETRDLRMAIPDMRLSRLRLQLRRVSFKRLYETSRGEVMMTMRTTPRVRWITPLSGLARRKGYPHDRCLLTKMLTLLYCVALTDLRAKICSPRPESRRS